MDTSQVEKIIEGTTPPEKPDLSKLRDEKCIPIAQEILKMLAEKPLPLGDLTEDQRKEYFPVTQRALKLLLEKDVTTSEVNYIMRLVIQCPDLLQGVVVASLNDNLNRAERKLWGAELKDVRLKQIDEILTKG